MRKLTIVAIALAVLSAAVLTIPASSDAVNKDCFILIKNEWAACGEKKLGLVLVLQNTCVETMQLDVCFEISDGTISCQKFIDIPTEGAIEAKSCDNTGKYTINACEKAEDCK